LAVFLAQVADMPAGTVFHIVPRDGKPEFYAEIVKESNESYTFRYFDPDPARRLTVQMLRSEVEPPIELTERSKQRVWQSMIDARVVQTPVGPVPREEYEFAQRALQMAEGVERSLANPEDQEEMPSEPVETQTADAPRPAFLTLWGPQIGLIAGALVLIGIIVKLVILGEEE
jgi:hypothetical protein